MGGSFRSKFEVVAGQLFADSHALRPKPTCILLSVKHGRLRSQIG